MLFSKKKKEASVQEEKVVINDPVKYLGASTNRLWSALNSLDEACVQYEAAILAASDKDIAKYDKAVNTARQEMKSAKFCVREVFGTLLAEVERGR